MTAAEIIPASQLVRNVATFLDADSVEGRTPAYIARRGRLDGVVMRLDVWEQLREQATLAADLAELDELRDRLAVGEARQSTLGEVAAELRPAMVLADLPISFVPHAHSDILTASRVAENTQNLAGFLAHFTRGYLRGHAICDPSRPGPIIERDVAPAYHEDQVPFRLVWARQTGDRLSGLTLLAVRPISGILARAWTFAPPMDATTEGE